MFHYASLKKDFYLAFKYKFNESWKYWRDTSKSEIKILTNVIKFLTNPDFRADIISKILEVVKTMVVLWLHDATFKNGTFQAGYAHGKLIFQIVQEVLLAAATGGGGNIAKGFMH